MKFLGSLIMNSMDTSMVLGQNFMTTLVANSYSSLFTHEDVLWQTAGKRNVKIFNQDTLVLTRASSLDFVQFKIRTIESQETKVALGFVTFVDKDPVEDIAVGPR